MQLPVPLNFTIAVSACLYFLFVFLGENWEKLYSDGHTRFYPFTAFVLRENKQKTAP